MPEKKEKQTTRNDAEKIALGLTGLSRNQVVLMTKFSPVPFSDAILEQAKLVCDKRGTLWLYDKEEGIWIPNSERILKSQIRKNLLGDEQQKKHYVDEILAHLKDLTFDTSFEIDNNPYLIGFKNKVYDLRDNQYKEFKPEFNLTTKLNININETNKECPKIDKFFEESIGAEHKNILYDLVAYTLFKRYPYPKLFFIFGSANTGKSKFMQLLELFLGDENRCSVEPQDIQKDPHATAQMLFKMANLCSDINYDSLDNINQVKKITGEDLIKVRNMYKEPYNARIFAKQIFTTNKLPVVKEKTKAWYKRVYLIDFSNIVEKEREDPFLIQKLTTQEELEGLAFKSLERLKLMKDRNFRFEFDIDVDEVERIYEMLSNPIQLFINENCLQGVEGTYIFQYEFKERFEAWLKANHFPPISNSEMKEYMRERFTDTNRTSFNGNKTYRAWGKITWKSQGEKSKDLGNPLNHFNHFNQLRKKLYIV